MAPYVASSNGRTYRIAVHSDADGLHVHLDDQVYPVDVLPVGPTLYSILLDGRSYEVDCHEFDGAWMVLVDGQPFPVDLRDDAHHALPVLAAPGKRPGGTITAPMSGRVVKIHVTVGEDLAPGAPVCTLEAMKMENEIAAPTGGTVRAVNVTAGETVRAGQILVNVGPATGELSTSENEPQRD
jgi:glutaconyl-CoA/methylmalonyl-CoA decarboxylase subunit gamma